MTSSWFILSTLNYDARSATHQLYIVSSYTRLNTGCIQWEVGGEVDTRSRKYHGGWEVWVYGGSVIICISELIIVRSMVKILRIL